MSYYYRYYIQDNHKPVNYFCPHYRKSLINTELHSNNIYLIYNEKNVCVDRELNSDLLISIEA